MTHHDCGDHDCIKRRIPDAQCENAHPVPLGPAELPPVLRMLDVAERALESLDLVVNEREGECRDAREALSEIMQARMILAGLRTPLSKPEEDELEERRRLS